MPKSAKRRTSKPATSGNGRKSKSTIFKALIREGLSKEDIHQIVLDKSVAEAVAKAVLRFVSRKKRVIRKEINSLQRKHRKELRDLERTLRR